MCDGRGPENFRWYRDNPGRGSSDPTASAACYDRVGVASTLSSHSAKAVNQHSEAVNQHSTPTMNTTKGSSPPERPADPRRSVPLQSQAVDQHSTKTEGPFNPIALASCVAAPPSCESAPRFRRGRRDPSYLAGGDVDTPGALSRMLDASSRPFGPAALERERSHRRRRSAAAASASAAVSRGRRGPRPPRQPSEVLSGIALASLDHPSCIAALESDCFVAPSTVEPTAAEPENSPAPGSKLCFEKTPFVACIC